MRSCDVDGSDVVGELASESVGLDDVEEPRRLVSARMSSRLTLYCEFGWTTFVSRSSVNFDVDMTTTVIEEVLN